MYVKIFQYSDSGKLEILVNDWIEEMRRGPGANFQNFQIVERSMTQSPSPYSDTKTPIVTIAIWYTTG